MNSAATFKWTTIVLMVLNIGLVAFIVMNKPGHPNHRGPEQNKHLISERLGFDESQNESYAQLIEAHISGIEESDQEITKAKKMLFELLLRDDPKAEEEWIDKINREQRKIERLHQDHFRAIKSLCTSDQLDDFETLTKDLGKMFGQRRGPSKPRPH